MAVGRSGCFVDDEVKPVIRTKNVLAAYPQGIDRNLRRDDV
jgi:hypothetical protein